jgi:DNA-binding CsgD family transcriptional regulator/tetratricopeptide (TPR) repeat protein
VGRPVLERERELGELVAAVQDAAAGLGSVVLVTGEAGIGKSSLVEAARTVLPEKSRLLVGYCDDLATSRALGPFRDLVDSVGAELARAVEAGDDRNHLLDALRAELSWAGHPTVLAVEDVHWADEATLDVLRYLVRRIAGLPAVLLLTYRDDEVDRTHPLRHLLGLAARVERVHRLPLARLSPEAVQQLSATTRLDATQVYALTSGNPFFVTEVIAAGDAGHAPPTIVDAILARVRTLDAATHAAVEQLAVIPSTLDGWLVDRLVPGGMGALATAERYGLVTVAPNRVGFRHELIRRALNDSLLAARRIDLNQRVLAALVDRDDPDLSAIVHHAVEAGDTAAIVRYAPAAGAEASRVGAHREAAAHLRLVLAHRSAYPPEELAELLGRYAIECYHNNEDRPALAAQREAVGLNRSHGDAGRLGESLRWLSRIEWWSGNRLAALDAAREAVTVLEAVGDVRLLGMAYSSLSQLHAMAADSAEAIEWGERAIALAREANDAAILSHALNNVGVARWNQRDPRGSELIAESLRVALAANEIDHACRAYVNIIWNLIEDLRLPEAERYLSAGMELADCAEHRFALTYMYAELAILKLRAGRWDEAVRAAEVAVEAQPLSRCPALVVLGLVQVRRGRTGGDELLAEAWRLAVELGELQRTGPAVVALAEAAWLGGGDGARVVELLETVHAEAVDRDARQLQAESSFWLTRFGRQAWVPGRTDRPYELLAAGRWREAAQAWQAAGCPYEYASALADSPEPTELLLALGELDALGAEPLARRVRARLRDAGVARIPRGPNDGTRRNPAGLTDRQVEVLRLLGENRTNVEIAERLVVSVRTVEHHVAAVLAKLGAPSRRAAAARAVELGVTSPDK